VSFCSGGRIEGAYRRFVRRVNGTTRYGIARLIADASGSTFNPTTGANDTVQSFAIQTDGKCSIAGNALLHK